jgi:hypothetical protein
MKGTFSQPPPGLAARALAAEVGVIDFRAPVSWRESSFGPLLVLARAPDVCNLGRAVLPKNRSIFREKSQAPPCAATTLGWQINDLASFAKMAHPLLTSLTRSACRADECGPTALPFAGSRCERGPGRFLLGEHIGPLSRLCQFSNAVPRCFLD